MKKITFLLVLIYFTAPIFSQEDSPLTFTVKGKIVNAETQSPLEYATVIFKNIKIDSLIYGSVTDSKGNFSLNINSGDYNAYVEFYSFKTKQLNISKINTDFNFGIIPLEIDTENLEEIEIIAEKKDFEFERNKLIVNVNKDIAIENSSAVEVLNNIPSVTITSNGAIQLQGQDAVVLINGKKSLQSKAEALQVLPANTIEKIEVITNPGARYSASYSRIVNIILKKGKDEGLNASITATTGYKDLYGGLINLNYNTQKVNFFSNISYSHSNTISLGNYENEYFSNNITNSFLNETNEFNTDNNGFVSTIGADFFIAEKTMLTTKVNYTNLDYENIGISYSDFLDANKTSTATNNRIYNNNFDDAILEFAINLEQNLKNEGQKITLSFLNSNDVEKFKHDIFNSNNEFTNENYIEKNTLLNSEIELTYSHPINENANFVLGYKNSVGRTKFTNTEITTINNIEYDDDENSAYAEFEYQGEKMYYGVGLRSESNKININYKDLNTSQEKKYNDLFPSAYFEYTVNDSKSISLSYNRSIARPSYAELQPFKQKISETSFFKGNETLEPIFMDQTNLSYNIFGEKTTFIVSAFFNKYNHYWQDVTYKTGEKINNIDKMITTPINIGHVDYYGINFSSMIKASNNLDFTANILLVNFDQKGVYTTNNLANEVISLNYNHKNLNGNFNLLTKLKIPTVFSIQTNIFHFLKSEGPYSVRKAYTYANLAIAKDLFNKRATLNFSVDDIFKSRKTKRDRFSSSYFSKTLIENRYRVIKFSLTYRFNQSIKDREIEFDKKDIKPKY